MERKLATGILAAIAVAFAGTAAQAQMPTLTKHGVRLSVSSPARTSGDISPII